MAHTAKDKTKSYFGRSLMAYFTDSNPLQVQKCTMPHISSEEKRNKLALLLRT